MVNKKIKKKTKWHPLSLAGGQDEEKQFDDPNKSRVPFKMEWKISQNTGENAPHYRNNSSTNATNSSTSHLHNSHLHNHHRFDKRASSNKTYSKSHHNNGYSATNTTGGNSYNKFGKQEHHSHKDFPKKVQFNEDEYTRITTPRQDVLFKKGYLSRPKTQPVTPTHQPYNGTSVEGFYPGYITADSPPLAIASPNGTEYPFIPAGHGAFMNDALNNVYGNPVYFMPYPDVYYPPPTSELDMGDQYNVYNNNLYSPPLIEEHDGSVSQPVTSTTSTNCSDECESSEEVTTTTTEAHTPTKELAEQETSEETPLQELPDQPETTKVEEIIETDVQQPTTTVSAGCYENGYDSINPYLNPYAPVYYYPMSFYPVPAMSPYSPTEYYQSPGDEENVVPGVNGFVFENGRHNKYPKRKKRYRKTLSSSGTSITDYSEDESMQHEITTAGSGDSGFTEAIKSPAEILEDNRPLAPCTPESINESIAHQSTLNVEVPEFRPKTVLEMTTNGFVANNTYKLNNKKTTYNKNGARETSKYSERTHNNKNQTKSKEVTNVRKPLSDKKLHTSTVPLVNGNNDNNTINPDATNNIIKKRTINPVLEKKILIESTKNIEMQNIDLMKTKSETLPRRVDVKVETTWVVVGGKRKMIQEEIPIEREKVAETIEHDKKVPEATNGIEITNDFSPSVNNAQPKKSSRKSKQKNKTQNKRNVPQGKNMKLQGFVIEEPSFASFIEPVPEEIVESAIEDECTPLELIESDTEELLEAALIETIPWTDADIAEVTNETDESTEKLSDLSEVSSASASIIINVNNNNETEHGKAGTSQENSEECLNQPCEQCDDEKTSQSNEELDQIKAEPILIPEMDQIDTTRCSSQTNVSLVEEQHINGFNHDADELEMALKESLALVKNGLTNNHVFETEMTNGSKDEVQEAICEKKTTVEAQSCPKTENGAAVLDICETQSDKYFLTAAVCNWLHSFNNNDLQSLFTIPLSPDFVQKIKYCTEISKYFADDELQNLDKFINENFCKFQHLSASSSLSSLLSDMSGSSDDEPDSTDEDAQKVPRSTKATKKALKLFGCEIM